MTSIHDQLKEARPWVDQSKRRGWVLPQTEVEEIMDKFPLTPETTLLKKHLEALRKAYDRSVIAAHNQRKQNKGLLLALERAKGRPENHVIQDLSKEIKELKAKLANV